MKVVLIFLLFSGFEVASTHKCDSYFVGNVIYRRKSLASDADDTAMIQGCKKGCFWNASYTEDGVPKCGKCSEIKDEIECLSHTTTCQWTKSKKCKSQSCPNISKSRITLVGNDNATKESQYRDLIKREKECVEGSALEQKYNNLYLADYLATWNYQYAIWNVDDTCTIPDSTVTGGGAYAWKATSDAAANSNACNKFIGYTYMADAVTPTADTCTRFDCSTVITTPAAAKQQCEAVVGSGCIYIKGESADGTQDLCVNAAADSCTRTTVGDRWVAGVNTSAECVETAGCMYVRGIGGSLSTGREDFRVKGGTLSTKDECVPGCGNTFVAGTSTRKDCEILGCKYTGSDSIDRPGTNLKTFKDEDLCPDERHPPTREAPALAPVHVCGINTTLALSSDACDDRTGTGLQCSISAFTTEETCLNAYGIWYLAPKSCRELFSTARSKCEFTERDQKSYTVYTNGHHGGNTRPGTKYERCVDNQYKVLDTFKTETVTGYDGVSNLLFAYLTLDDHERIYGYRTPEEYCKHQTDVGLQACQRAYAASVANCHATTAITGQQVNPNDWKRSSVEIKAARSACHRMYGCMYSKSNERCSVWAVWAFIFTIVLTVVVFVVILGVGVVVVLPILRKSSA